MAALGKVLSGGIHLLSQAGISSPALDAALLLAEASGLSREQLYTHQEKNLDGEQTRRYGELLERRKGGECTAYLLGRKEFWGLEFLVNPSVLVPRPETEILVEAALDILHRRMEHAGPPSALDLCTGSGAVAIALKHECPYLELWAADIDEAALATARTNAERLLPAKQAAIHFVRGDLFDALKNTETPPSRFSLITANAPYIPTAALAELPPEVRREPALALDGGPDGLSLIRRIIAAAPQFLENGGTLVLEADPSQMTEISVFMKAQGFHEPELRRDLAGHNRVITGKKVWKPADGIKHG